MTIIFVEKIMEVGIYIFTLFNKEEITRVVKIFNFQFLLESRVLGWPDHNFTTSG